MKTYTEAYKKAQETIKNDKFHDDWNNFMQTKARLLLGDTGLHDGMSSTLKKLQNKIRYPTFLSRFFRSDGTREAATILVAAREDTNNGLANRAATLKFLRHMHFLSKRGAQSIWVCSPPESYKKWVFDEFAGKNKKNLEMALAENQEIFNSEHMKNMHIGTIDALKWCQKTLMVLANAKSTTATDTSARDMVKRWFADENTTDTQLNTIINTLDNGFKKIRDVCNSNQLIFSDDPIDRSTEPQLWASTYALVRNETLSVIYIEKVLMGRSGTRFEWACTIVHELSHREMATRDHFYSESGLKPNTATFPSAKALDNADNYGFFAADCNGQLTVGKRNSVLQAPTS